MKKTYLFSIVSLLLFTPCDGQVDSNISENTAEINKLISTYAAYGAFNGAILVAEEGMVIYKKGFGLANMEWDIPNQVDTKFRISSITKLFTAILIMQLVSDGKSDLHAPIITYLPDYP